MFLHALLMTVMLSLATVLISSVLGSLMALMRISNSRILRGFATAYVSFIRGTPLMVQIFMVFYGLPLLGINLPTFEFLGTDFSRFFSGLLALVINSIAYVCEIVRGGIQSIDDGQMEAARSLGFNKRQAMLYIIFPQALKNILPALGNEFVSVIKESSQVSIIGLAELMYITTTVRSISFRSFEPLLIVSLLYFLVTSVCSYLVNKMEKKMSVSNRSSN
ncbi:MAG: amino acid ABC transporter permease [Ruminiclostridium sp.]|nr:amino acid ABC transporter permease [Ruminiclostridium sp.]